MSGYSKVEGDQLPPPAKLPAPSGGLTKSMTQSERIAKFLADSGEKALPAEAGAFLKACEPVIAGLIKCFIVVAPLYKKAYIKAYEIYEKAPKNVIQMCFGVALCFFGGTYVASIAAIEAFRQLGWQTVQSNLVVVYEQAQVVLAANEADDKKDDDGDGIADVNQIEASALAKRKITVAMTAVTEPQRLQVACGALFAAYLAVLATLRLEFARTTAFALGIVEMAKFPIVRTLAPLVAVSIGPDLAHWTQTLVETTLTFFAIVFAWILQVRDLPTTPPFSHIPSPSLTFPHLPSPSLTLARLRSPSLPSSSLLQMIISAFYSGLRGGRLFADALIAYLEEKDLMSKVHTTHRHHTPRHHHTRPPSHTCSPSHPLHSLPSPPSRRAHTSHLLYRTCARGAVAGAADQAAIRP